MNDNEGKNGAEQRDAKKRGDEMPGGEMRGANPELLKRDIDAGVTGDKVAFPDPAAAPLGTDEAAGTPITPAQLAMAQKTERLPGVQAAAAPPTSATSPRGRDTRPSSSLRRSPPSSCCW